MLAESLIRQNVYAATIERWFVNGNGKEWESTMCEWEECECKKPFPIISISNLNFTPVFCSYAFSAIDTSMSLDRESATVKRRQLSNFAPHSDRESANVSTTEITQTMHRFK